MRDKCPICGSALYENEYGGQCVNYGKCSYFFYHPHVLRSFNMLRARETPPLWKRLLGRILPHSPSER